MANNKGMQKRREQTEGDLKLGHQGFEILGQERRVPNAIWPKEDDLFRFGIVHNLCCVEANFEPKLPGSLKGRSERAP